MSDPRRTVSLHVRVTPEERDDLRRRAKAVDTDVSSYLLDCALPERTRVDGRASRWGEARELSHRLAPGDRLGLAELGDLRSSLVRILRSQGLDLADRGEEVEVVRVAVSSAE